MTARSLSDTVTALGEMMDALRLQYRAALADKDAALEEVDKLAAALREIRECIRVGRSDVSIGRIAKKALGDLAAENKRLRRSMLGGRWTMRTLGEEES
jgi:hypothetical protein